MFVIQRKNYMRSYEEDTGAVVTDSSIHLTATLANPVHNEEMQIPSGEENMDLPEKEDYHPLLDRHPSSRF